MKIIATPCGMLSANMYTVYDDSRRAIVIDPIDCDILEQQIKTHSLTVCAIFLTHAHYDHAADLEKIKDLTQAPAYVVAQDQPFLSDPRKNVSLFLSCPVDLGSCDQLLSDGDVLAIGDFTVRVMHTPGHTPGSACFAIDHALFTGDTVMANGIGRCDLYGGDTALMRESLRNILSIGTPYQIYPGHGPSASLSDVKPMLRYYIT